MNDDDQLTDRSQRLIAQPNAQHKKRPYIRMFVWNCFSAGVIFVVILAAAFGLEKFVDFLELRHASRKIVVGGRMLEGMLFTIDCTLFTGFVVVESVKFFRNLLSDIHGRG